MAAHGCRARGCGRDFEANALYREFTGELRKIVGNSGHRLTIACGQVSGASTLVVGTIVDKTGRINHGEAVCWDAQPEVLPLTGLAMPYDDGSIDQCHVLRPIAQLPRQYRDKILGESARVAHVVTQQA